MNKSYPIDSKKVYLDMWGYLEKHPHTVNRLAPKIGVDRETLRRFLHKKSRSTLATLMKIKSFLDNN